MKAFYLAAVVVGAMSVAVAQVSPEDHAAHHPDQAAAATKKAAPASATPSAKTAPADAAVTHMQARTKSIPTSDQLSGEQKSVRAACAECA